jgi:hypothetical protein
LGCIGEQLQCSQANGNQREDRDVLHF